MLLRWSIKLCIRVFFATVSVVSFTAVRCKTSKNTGAFGYVHKCSLIPIRRFWNEDSTWMGNYVITVDQFCDKECLGHQSGQWLPTILKWSSKNSEDRSILSVFVKLRTTAPPIKCVQNVLFSSEIWALRTRNGIEGFFWKHLLHKEIPSRKSWKFHSLRSVWRAKKDKVEHQPSHYVRNYVLPHIASCTPTSVNSCFNLTENFRQIMSCIASS